MPHKAAPVSLNSANCCLPLILLLDCLTGVADGFWEYRLKPWDVAAGVLMVKEAGGTVTDMEGGPYSVFSRSTLATNGIIHNSLVSTLGSHTADLAKKDDLTPWFIPPGYDFELE